MNEQFEQSLAHRQRQLSRFMAREMLLDYAEGRLDVERQKALEEYLPRDKESQKEFEAIKGALAYTKALSQIQVATQTANEIDHTKLGFAKWTDRLAWRNWPEVARWSMEAVLVSAVVAAVVSLLPLQKLSKWLPSSTQELILSEIENSPEESEKKETIADALSVPAPDVSEKINVAFYGPTTAELMAPAPIPAPVQTAANADVEVSDSPRPEKAPKGFVYRAFMASTAIDESTEAVKTLVATLGGERAGQVALGWRKNSGTYFHFALPESNYESLLTSLRSFSPVRIYKDPHWRVMPEGQIRLILFIEDTKK